MALLNKDAINVCAGVEANFHAFLTIAMDGIELSVYVPTILFRRNLPRDPLPLDAGLAEHRVWKLC